MMQLIIWKQESGRVAIFTPAPEALDVQSIQQIAQLVVPNGKPYKIIEDTDLPEDRSQRDAWTVDDEELTDGFGGAQ